MIVNLKMRESGEEVRIEFTDYGLKRNRVTKECFRELRVNFNLDFNEKDRTFGDIVITCRHCCGSEYPCQGKDYRCKDGGSAAFGERCL